MANKIKSTKAATPAVENLKKDKEEKIEVKKLLKDERTHKITGSIFILLALLFFIAFTSYLFTWAEDQSEVMQEGAGMLLGTESKVANLMGEMLDNLLKYHITTGFNGCHLHDPVALMAVTNPEMIKTKPLHVDIELQMG